jgi:hypothetical protein
MDGDIARFVVIAGAQSSTDIRRNIMLLSAQYNLPVATYYGDSTSWSQTSVLAGFRWWET